MSVMTIQNKRRKKRRRKIILLSVMAIVLALVLIYLVVSLYFKSHFFPRTEINGLKVGGKTVSEGEEKISREVGDYLLTIHGRDGEKYHITGRDIESTYVPDGSLDQALEQQNIFAWLPALFHNNTIDVPTPMNYREEALRQTIAALPCFMEENIVHPVNAVLERIENGYQITPEIMGNEIIADRLVECVGEAVRAGEGDITLTDDVYVNPEIIKEDPTLVDALNRIEQVLNGGVVYQIADYDEQMTPQEIFNMLQVGEDYSLSLDEERLTVFVQSLASKYNTYADVRQFATSSGDTVAIGGGDYGWIINKEAEAQQLKEDILSGQKVTREPVYSQRAKVEGLDDIGDTYAEIDYTKQHMWYYENGQLKLESDIVSGNMSAGNGSPDGIFKIVYKQSPATLTGENYRTEVSYFMPFAYDVGFHDAPWKSQFGGEFYKTTGSNGCINMPGDKAQQLYGMIQVDTPVIAYYREHVELKSESCGRSNAFSYVDPEKEGQE